MLDWEAISPQIKEASDVNKQVEKLSRDVEKLIQRRNNLTPVLGEFVHQSRDILSGLYRAEMRTLTDFGFEVDDTPKPKKNGAPKQLAVN